MFDSGVGGLTVARAVMNQLPNEQILYIGDTANSPYGPRPIAQVRQLALHIMDEVMSRRNCSPLLIKGKILEAEFATTCSPLLGISSGISR